MTLRRFTVRAESEHLRRRHSAEYREVGDEHRAPPPADEAGQTVTFSVTGNTNPALFTVLPSIARWNADLSRW